MPKMKLSKKVIDFLGTDDYTDEILNEKIGEILTENASLKTENEGLGDATEKLEELKPMAEVGETYLDDMRKKAEASYKLLKGEDASKDMIELIQDSGIKQAKTYVEEFAKEIEEKIPGVCSECGKEATLTRRSSKELQEERKKDAEVDSYKTGRVA